MAQIDTLTNVGAVVSTDLALILRGGANVLGTFGSLVGQNATSVTITGGTINGTIIGATTPASVAATTLTTTGNNTFAAPVFFPNSVGLKGRNIAGDGDITLISSSNDDKVFIDPSAFGTRIGGALTTTGAATFGGLVTNNATGENLFNGTGADVFLGAQVNSIDKIRMGVEFGVGGTHIASGGNLNFRVGGYTAGFNKMTLDASGNLTATGAATFGGDVVAGGGAATARLTSYSDGSALNTLQLKDTRALAADVGGAMVFQALQDGAGTYGTTAAIVSGRLNATSGNTQGYLSFFTGQAGGLAESMRLDTSGNLVLANGLISISSSVAADANNNMFTVTKTAVASSLLVNAVSLQGYSAAACAMQVGQSAGLGRSINAGGTINASGADYAEYEQNNGLTIIKGSVVGFKSDGTLTLTFSEAVRFAIKSTNPSYVGGDTWGTEEQVGIRPVKPADDAADEVVAEYEADLATFETALEAARQLVDRIAYSGKVPVNVQVAAAGDYIIAVAADDGSIDGQAVSDPDFSQYKLSVGRVNRILDDGRAEVAVIIH